MELENQIKSENITTIKELVIDKEEFNHKYIDSFQQKIIEFCKNINFLQNQTNFFNLSIKDQFEFNSCIDNTTEKIKEDFKQMESMYLNCRSKCIEKDREITDQLLEYNSGKYKVFRAQLPPCIEECKSLYEVLNRNYAMYMVKSKYKFLTLDNGIYTELI